MFSLENGDLGPLLFNWMVYLLGFAVELYVVLVLYILSPYQIKVLQIFPPILKAVSSLYFFFYCVKVF
jgi:hypothetical protein